MEKLSTNSIWENFKLALTRWNIFHGRSRRTEFWSFFLVTAVIGIIANKWDYVLFDKIAPFDNLINIIFFLPTIAVGARRLHDTNRSGWWQLIGLTGIGYIVLFIFWAQDGEKGPNEYGESPKYSHEPTHLDTTFQEEDIV